MPPVDQMTNLGTTIVDVNLKTGEVTTHPLESASTTAKGVDARFFGAPNTISHTFTLEGGAPSGTHVFTLDDHIENVFSFPIGTHVAHATGAFPEDTMGVYVYVSIAPTVTAGCTAGPGCSVVDSGDGSFPFTSATPQPYMFFKTILEAADGTPHHGLDFTDQSAANGGTGINYFRSLAFHATSGVTNFKFGVSVSAAAVKPNDIRWRVNYIADSLPNRVGTLLTDLRSEPDWRVIGLAGGVVDTSIQTTGCATGTSKCLRIVSTDPSTQVPADTFTYFRSDSLGTTDSAYIAVVSTMLNLDPNAPSVFLGMQDPVKQVLVGFSSNKVGFCTAANTFITNTQVTANPQTTQSWRVVKYAADSVAIFGAGVHLVTLPYSSLPDAPSASARTAFFFFGNRALKGSPSPKSVTSLWSSVVYEIGVTGP